MNNRASIGAIGFALFVVIIWTILRVEHFHQVISWDAFGYYLYLPAIFIHGDVAIMDIAWFQALFDTYSPSATIYQLNSMDDGGRAIKYPIGLAILWAPFFAIAHWVAGIMDMPQDGLSRPYHWSLIIGSWCYFALGLIWLRKVLLSSFSDRITALTLVIIVFGSNLLYMLVFDPLMPHAFLFTLYAGIIWYSIRWHQQPSDKASMILGILVGLAAIVRNTELIALMIPLLWGLWDSSFREHMRKLWRHRHQLLVAMVTMALVCLPQLLYWKEVTGQYIYSGYTNAGEGLDLLSPNVADVLFSYRKGLVIYTPLVVLALFGIWRMRKSMSPAIPAIPLYLLVNFWIVSSWTIWWYADSYGNRGFVQSYVALSIPLAALFQWGHERVPKVTSMLSVALALLLVLNLFQTWQAGAGILHTSRMTKEAYWAIFGRTSMPAGLEELLVVQRAYDGTVTAPDRSQYRSVAVDEQWFEEVDPGFPEHHYTDPYFRSGKAAYRLDAEIPWNAAIGRRFGEMTSRDHLYARYTIHLFIPEQSPHPDCVIVLAIEHTAGRYGELMHIIQPEELVPGEWNEMDIWYLTPHIRHRNDVMRAYLWLRDQTPIWVDDVRLEVFEPAQ